MSKRYEIRYSEIYEYEVVKETEQTITVTNRYKFIKGDKPSRMNKAGTYPTAREALQAELDSVRSSIASLETKLDREKQQARKYAQILSNNADDKLIDAFEEVFAKGKYEVP